MDSKPPTLAPRAGRWLSHGAAIQLSPIRFRDGGSRRSHKEHLTIAVCCRSAHGGDVPRLLWLSYTAIPMATRGTSTGGTIDTDAEQSGLANTSL